MLLQNQIILEQCNRQKVFSKDIGFDVALA